MTTYDIKEVFAARKRISAFARTTPVFSAQTVSEKLGFELFLKAENLQKTGSFKIRGASNFILKRMEAPADAPAPPPGIVAASSGNHGQAVAHVAGRLNIPAVIVMPEGATKAKVNAARSYGATVEFCGRTSPERLQRSAHIAATQNYLEVPPYDHPDIIAGQGTVGAEILEQLPHADTVLVPIGGGGLISGISLAIKELRPDIRVIGVEPAGSNSMYASRRQGALVKLPAVSSIADGLLTLIPGTHTFACVQKYVDDIILVEEAEIRAALRACLERFKIMPEPSGAVSIAAALNLHQKVPGFKGRRVVAVVSGGNADLDRLPEYLQVSTQPS